MDGFEAMIAGGSTSGIAVGVNELAAARFSRWRRFFAAFFETVSMVTENGNRVCEWRRSKTEPDRVAVDCEIE